MEYNNFKEELLYKMKKIDIELTEKQVKQFYNYMNLLIEWNNKINLTAITEPKEIILKHFVDCATINKFIDKYIIIILQSRFHRRSNNVCSHSECTDKNICHAYNNGALNYP